MLILNDRTKNALLVNIFNFELSFTIFRIMVQLDKDKIKS